MTQHYVCGFMRGAFDKIVLIRKNKPAWQVDKLNGIGGSVEPDEDIEHAMIREWKEEVGWDWTNWRYFCKYSGEGFVVHFFSAIYDPGDPPLPTTNDRGEIFHYIDIFKILQRDDPISNLKWLIPLAFLQDEKDGVFIYAKEGYR